MAASSQPLGFGALGFRLNGLGFGLGVWGLGFGLWFLGYGPLKTFL